MINQSLAEEMRLGHVKINFDSEVVEIFFKKCEQTTRVQVEQWFGNYATIVFGVDGRDQFIDIVHQRMIHIRPAVLKYFSCENFGVWQV